MAVVMCSVQQQAYHHISVSVVGSLWLLLCELERKVHLGTLGNILGLQLAVRLQMEYNTHVIL